MALYSGPVQARNALMDWLYDREEAIPEDVRDELREYIKEVSPVVSVIKSIKLVVDRMIDCGPELRLWASDAAIMCANYGFDEITVEVAELLRPE